MNVVFYVSAGIAVVSTLMVITRLNAVHALIYLIISLLAVAVIAQSANAALSARRLPIGLSGLPDSNVAQAQDRGIYSTVTDLARFLG